MSWRSWDGPPEQRRLTEVAARRSGWFLRHTSLRRLANMATAVAEYVGKRDRIVAWPVVLKIDISPLCNLRCPTCVHADPGGSEALESQSFHAGQLMTIDQYRRIIDECGDKSAAVSLCYLGDPLVHPDLFRMCGIAREAGLNVHISTNLSFPLTDERIRQLVTSGLTHLSVCVDGMSQATYQLTRVGGRVDWVLSNLERICSFRREIRQAYPRVEVQYIKFRHNVDELEEARLRFREIGVDDVTEFWGSLHNYVDCDPGTYAVRGPKEKRLLPWCYWPYLFMVIKYNGDVIPCCNHRVGAQYGRTDDPRTMGNVFETSVREVWNSPQYRVLRRLVSDPGLVKSDTSLEASFCCDCPRLFDTDRGDNRRHAQQYAFEDLYEIGPNGTPVRKRHDSSAAALAPRRDGR